MTQELIPASTELPSLATYQSRPANAASVYLSSLGSKESRRVMASYLSIIARMVAEISDIKATSYLDFPWGILRKAQVTAIVAMLNESGRSPATVNTYLHALKGTAREAWALKQMDSEEFQHIKSVKTVRGSRLPAGRVLSNEDINELLNTTESDRSEAGVRDYAMLLLLLSAGLRRTEVVDLDCSSVDFKDLAIKVKGKGNKERIAFIDHATADALKYWIDQVRGEENGPLFCRIRKGGDVQRTRLSSQSVLYILQKRCLEVGIELATPHDLRRTFATMMIDDGEDLITVRDSMGHASVETTQRYIRLNHDKRRKASAKLGQRLAGTRN